ncbi:hypothetical protein KXR53_11535 [Inquilinus limosus]|uniref:hypothetical protein n=1 Tax=Inquilinus limosus TaxID=171674 RepID=UPI003F169A8F
MTNRKPGPEADRGGPRQYAMRQEDQDSEEQRRSEIEAERNDRKAQDSKIRTVAPTRRPHH